MSARISAAVVGVSIVAFFISISIASAIIFNDSGEVGGAVPRRPRWMSELKPWRTRARTCCAQDCSSKLENAARPSSLMRQ